MILMVSSNRRTYTPNILSLELVHRPIYLKNLFFLYLLYIFQEF